MRALRKAHALRFTDLAPTSLALMLAAGAAPAAASTAGSLATGPPSLTHERGPVRVVLRPRVIDLFHSDSIGVSGIRARGVEVRALGAIDASGRAYEWTPYRWRRLRLQHGTWHGLLPAPPLFGIYQLQLRLDPGRDLSSARWLLRVFPGGSEPRRSFRSPVAVVRDFVAHLPGRQVLVALSQLPLARFDHRDRRLHREFAIAYAPRNESQPGSRLGAFVTAVRDGFHGRWRLLEVTAAPYD